MYDCSGKVFLKNGKTQNELSLIYLLRDISHYRRHAWDKES